MKNKLPEIEPVLSEMERIRLRSIDPKFFKKCEIATQIQYETAREIEYQELLDRRAVAERELCDKARRRYEEMVKNL